MTLQDKHDGWKYYCVITDSHGKSVKSNTVKINVGTPLKITTQPVNYAGAVGSTAKFTVKAQGDGLTYQWYYKTPSATSFSKCTTAPGTTANYSIAVQAKRYSGTVGAHAVQELLSGIAYYQTEQGLVVTNAYFSRQARELAEKGGVTLWDRDDLVKYCRLR